MIRCPRCGSEAIEEINYTTYKCHECGYIIRNPDDLSTYETNLKTLNFFQFFITFFQFVL